MSPDAGAQATGTKSFAERYSSSSIVKVIVGPGLSPRFYNLHKALLVDKSDYFRTCFNVNLREARTNQVSLTEDGPEAFDCFVNWAYTGSVSRDMTIEDCIKAFILADKLVCPRQLLSEIAAAFYNAAESTRITLKHLEVIVESGLTDSELMDAAIVELANAVGGNWEAFEKDETWQKILAADAGLTLRVLSALRSSWTQSADSVAPKNVTAAAVVPPLVHRGSKRRKVSLDITTRWKPSILPPRR